MKTNLNPIQFYSYSIKNSLRSKIYYVDCIDRISGTGIIEYYSM